LAKGELRSLPAVHRILDEPRVARFIMLLGAPSVKQHVTAVLDTARKAAVTPSATAIVDDVLVRLGVESRRGLTGVLNGTGILLHTNLGRAPLAAEAIDAIAATAAGATNIEYELDSGVRGSRYDRLRALLRAATGAEDALVVNNCAAAVLLVLDTLARGADGAPREVIVSRNQLVEIGGGFRLPDVLARSGATLVEVGATNKVRIDDYARALSPRTALLLRAHPSNYRIEGFTADVGGAELVALGRQVGVTVVEDLGSGALVDLREYGLPHERTVQEAIGEGIDLVAFSGDKLLGGPQAGIIVGRAAPIQRMRANPLLRALRVGTPTIAALGATLRLHLEPGARERIPFFRMLATSLDALRARVEAIRARHVDLDLAIVPTEGYVGAGSLPLAPLASVALAWRPAHGDANAAAARLRHGTPPVVARVEGADVLIDVRTIPPDRDGDLEAALEAAG
jgi:L-seryl-tRNA(Ser) seleniumtransferase